MDCRRITRFFSRNFSVVALAAGALSLAACASAPQRVSTPAPKPHYKIGAPYKISGRWYRPREDAGYNKTGIASWYGDAFHGKATANGEIFDKNRMSAAHTTLPLPSMVEVENLENGRKVIVRVNDRGPFVDDRLIDLSRAAAEELGFLSRGLAKVRVRYLGYADLTAKADRPGAKPRLAARPLPEEPTAATAPTAVSSSTGPSAVKPASDADDLIGRLITAHAAPATPSLAPSTVARTSVQEAAAPAVYWVEIETFSNLNELENARLSLENKGRLAVFSSDQAGTALHTLRLGPYNDIKEAQADAARAIDAGFPKARLVGAPS